MPGRTRHGFRASTIRKGYRRHLGELVHGGRNRGAQGRRYTARPCGSTRSFRRSQAATPSGSTRCNLRDGLRAAGIDSDIYYGSHTPDVEHEGRPVIELGRTGRDRWLLYQASIGSPVYDILAARAEPKLVNYHNITPAALLRDWEPAVAYEVALGRTQLARLAPQSRFAVADSAFNESELSALGYEGTAVVPLLIDMQAKSDEPDPELVALAGPPQGARGRGRPAVRGEDLAAQGAARPGQDARRPAARLRPGGPRCTWSGRRSARPTSRRCAAFIDELGLTDAVNLAGSVSGAELEAYFRAADVFVCASDHEGFCVPLAEAMGHGVPIVAYGVTAVPETVGGAGLVLRDKSPVPFAAAVGRVLEDATLRAVLAAAGTGAGGRLRPGGLDAALRLARAAGGRAS